MPSPKSTSPTRRNAVHSEQRDRAARLRDTAGRFTRASDKPSAAPSHGEAAPRGFVPVPADTPNEAYALRVQGDGLGLHAAPGASLILAPERPTGAGLAAFYMKGKDMAVIFDLTHRFRPEYTQMIEVVEPATGRVGGLRAERVEKIHRVTGVYTPAEVAEKHRPAPTPLPIMRECPEGMGKQYVDDAVAYPLVRKGETVVYDPSKCEPEHGALCMMQWDSGSRDVMMTNRRQPPGSDKASWFVDPVALRGNGAIGPFYSSDGPYDANRLREKIVGTVVGVLVPERLTLGVTAPTGRAGAEG